MKLIFLSILVFSMAANSAENVKELSDDAGTSDVRWTAMLGHVDPSISKAVAETQKNEATPPPHYQSAIAFSSTNTNIMTAAFIEAKVPDCLHSEGLKRQPTFLLGGYLALPFIAVAKVRGKCI